MMDSFRQPLKACVISIMGSGLPTALRTSALRRSEALTILNFHRVDDKAGGFETALKPVLFDELVAWLKRRFAIVTFEDLTAAKPGSKPPLVLSFDDGYKDFIDIVVPILEKHAVRVNQNLIPAALESGLPPMNVQLQEFIWTAPSALLRETPLPGLPRGADPDNRVKSGLQASKALKNRPIAEQKALFQTIMLAFQRFDAFRASPIMSIDEARQIAAVHEIGAHSFEHATMAEETDAYLIEDAGKCLDFFERRLGMRPGTYAFPNGGARPGQAELIRAAGFSHVLLTGEGFSRRSNWLHKRFTMFAGSRAEARFRALGGLQNPLAAKPAFAH